MYPATHAATSPDKPAVVMAGSGETMTYRELDERSNRLAHLLRQHGLQPGDNLAFCLENGTRFYEIAWAAQRAGLLYTAISTRLTGPEVEYIVDDCGAKAFIASPYVREAAEHLTGRSPGAALRLVIGGELNGYESYEDAVAAMPAEPIPDEVEGADMLYSSGTTGQPKGVRPPLLLSPVPTPSAVTLLGQMLYGFTPGMIYLSPAPLYHAAPLRFTMAAHRVGGTVVVMEHFDPEEYLRLVDEHDVTHTQVVPTMFVRMLKLDESVRAKYDVSTLACCIHAAAPCPVPVKEDMIGWWGPVLHEYYAGTEGNGFVACNSEEWLAHKGTVGRSLVGVLHVCDAETGEELPVGSEGVVYFEAPGGTELFEYHNDPVKTKRSRHPQHPDWSTLSDVGRLDEDGFLYLTDRKDFMIITGGVNVYPQESENVLVTHPKVMDAAVFGVPNEDFGEEVKAVVQPIDMADAGPELERELISWCRSQLADVKCPRTVDFEAELPRHATGKLYKRLLRDRYWSGRQSKIV